MILGIDTSAGQCAVALAGPEGVKVRREPMSRGHAEALFPMIHELLGGSFAGLTKIAVCTGPGSFTGIRVGVSAARGLALGCAIPCIGITRFEALAADHPDVTVVLGGRAGSVFVQSFAVGLPLGPPSIMSAAPSGPLIGDGVPGAAEDAGLIDPAALVAIAASRDAGLPPAPLYLRDADAAPPREGPPLMLD